MSATPADVRFEQDPKTLAPKKQGGLPLGASVYGVCVAIVALSIAIPVVLHLHADTRGWVTFGILALGAALTQLYVVRTARDTAFHTTTVFLIPAALLLPPELVALIAIVQHVPDWLKRRLPFHIQTFNIANYTLSTMGAWAVAHEVSVSSPITGPSATPALAGVAVC